ncbi:MAG: cobalamin-dependent protein [Deltaproteobacteria bacterium]
MNGREIRRVLLITPPASSSGSAAAGALLPVGLAGLAQTLRAAGIEAEIYDAMVSALGPDSIRLAIEHSYPQAVVVAACSATAEAARDVLRAAKEIVPGVFTVIVGQESAGGVVRGGATDDVVDCIVDDDASRLAALLARIGKGEQGAEVCDVSNGLT